MLNEECYDDYSCQINLYCWYATEDDSTNGVKRCIERYAKPEDYEFGWGDSLDSLMTDEEYNGI